ncbi:exosortase family protein XrtF [Fulvivirga ulvae]|uniref:exosortase family protein XrtF n=1 Tax=Fulvivirga ulvae TaxID=2904245 RepID=UPI001F2C00B4|nr:exosortase family protein XrtF [Fulvivirga ulvae]UII31641.1 exosortase family protein XrtF [Fulvivirga ulvae]
MSFFKEFKPAITFLVKFLVIYAILNLCYGLYISFFSPQPDPLTEWVTDQSVLLLDLLGYATSPSESAGHSSIDILLNGNNVILSVYEGCNGANVAIIFVAFLFSFGHLRTRLVWFLPVGLVVIHLVNLLRIVILFSVAIHLPEFMYFAHKYFFTAFIYFAVFYLWYVWINKLYKINSNEGSAG